LRETKPISLAHAPEFRLGAIAVRPALRQVVHADGREDVLEPRVMQVLVALAQARGAIVTRDDLIQSCWEGRVVGEDAINRVISRLRRLAEGMGRGSFRIETITKVGYRLLVAGGEVATPPAPTDGERPARLNRRTLAFGGGGLAVLAGAGVALLGPWNGGASRRPPADIAPLLDQAGIAMQQGTAEGTDQAIGLLRRAIETRPDHADAWGMLAVCYAVAAPVRAPQFEADLRARASEAARRADGLQRGNAYARTATALLIPRLGRWAEIERQLRGVVADHPRDPPLRAFLAELLGNVGRWREAARLMDEVLAQGPPSPGLVHGHVQALWAAGRREEADRAASRAFALYPSHFAVWFARFHLLLYTGRAQEALAQNQNVEGRPAAIPQANFQMNERVAGAMLSRSPAAVDEALRQAVDAARLGAGHAENAIQYAAALNKPDLAFQICEAYFFGRGFEVADIRFAPEQRIYTRRDNRRTQFLFHPSTASLRADPRFDDLTRRLGLERYWREMAVRPDYQLG
jgi:DNA-binding winged helix-turn-helix (wHTH) protein/tetratricopeptide (TPR) repeat protein